MNTTDRTKFMSIQTGDTIVYLDDEGVRCEGVVTGWKNHNDLPALLCGDLGEMVVTLAQVVSRSRNGATKKWPAEVA